MMLNQSLEMSADRTCSVVARILNRRSISTVLTYDSDLREMGLASLDMVNLILAVESEFGISIPEREMIPENFKSVLTIQALLTSLEQAKPPSETTFLATAP